MNRRLHKRRLVLLAGLLVSPAFLLGCGSSGTTDVPLPGTIYLTAGADPSAASLYRFTTHPFGFQLVYAATAPGRGVDAVTGNAGILVVADSRSGVTTLDRVTAHGLKLIPGVPERAYLPAVLTNGTVGFATIVSGRRPDGSRLPRDYQVVSVDPTTGAKRVLLHDPMEIGGLAFGPDGALAVAEFSTDYKSVFLQLISREGDRHKTTLSGPSYVSWNSDGSRLLIAGDLAHGGTTVIDASMGQRIAKIDGWRGLAWSPDNHQVLVTKGSTLALWTPGAKDGPKVVGSVTSPAQIYGAAWLIRDVT